VALLVVHFVHSPRSFPHGAFAIPARAAALLWQREFFCCAGFASCHPAEWILFVTPLSFLTPHWSRHMFWMFNFRVDLALQRDRHRLGFIVSHSHLWPLANGAHAYAFAYPYLQDGTASFVLLVLGISLGSPDQSSAWPTSPRLTRPAVGLTDQSSAHPTSRRLTRQAVAYWISSSIPNRKRFDHLSVFAPISAHIHRVQPLLTGYSRNGRFISNQRGNINTVTMPFIEKYSPLEIFQK